MKSWLSWGNIMPFIQRDKNNKIIALFTEAQEKAQEELSSSHQDVINFLKIPFLKTQKLSKRSEEKQGELLVQSDAEFIRVLEDLISVLLDKHVLLLTDLPPAAQEKLLHRQKIRSDYVNIMDEEDDIF